MQLGFVGLGKMGLNMVTRLARAGHKWWEIDMTFYAIRALQFVGLAYEVDDRKPVGRASELRCIRVVGAMLESGDWLVPHVGGVVRLQKPPLFYWVGSATATGQLRTRIATVP